MPMLQASKMIFHRSSRTTVTVGGESFESPGSYCTIKQAEEAAAHVALMALSTDAFQENDIHFYKNLLQEFARGEGFFTPLYMTTGIGDAHDHTFYATVEVEGETFHGNPAKSKKQAELNAAKVAYTAFMQRKSSWMGDFLSSTSEDEALRFGSCLNLLNLADEKEEDEETVFSGSIEDKYRFKLKEPISVPLDPGKCSQTDDNLEEEVLKLIPQTTSDSNVKIRGTLKSIYPTSTASTAKYEVQLEASNLDASTLKMPAEIKSYLLNNRIRVYTYIPDVSSPEGNVVLPVAEGKWVVVSLDFSQLNDT